MKYVKMLGLLAVAAAALMAFAGSAAATTLTSPTGTALPNGTTITASSKHTSLDGTIALTCTSSTVEGKIESQTAAHAKGKISKLTFSSCGSDTIEPLKNADGSFGELTIDSAGKLTSIGSRVTALTHRFIFVPITTHCIYNTGAGTALGTLDDSHDTGTKATLTIGTATGGAPIPEEATDTSACKDDAIWTGDYTIDSPNPLYID